VTEIIIGAIMGVSLSMAGQREMATGTIIFFWILTTLTIASGPLALIGATVEKLSKKPIGLKVFLVSLFVVFIISTVGFSVVGYTALKEDTSAQTSPTKTPEYVYMQDSLHLYNVKLTTEKLFGEIIGYYITGEIKNKGNKTLKNVELIVYLLDKDENPISEESFYAVWASDFNLDPQTRKPLKPGYVRKFQEKIFNPPSEWAKKVKVRIKEVEFQTD
jgi:hypothetical protein